MYEKATKKITLLVNIATDLPFYTFYIL